MRGFKSCCSIATRSAAAPVATRMKLWQRGFYEHIIRKEENIADVAEYILNNPVRQGLVQDGEYYEWCELTPVAGPRTLRRTKKTNGGLIKKSPENADD